MARKKTITQRPEPQALTREEVLIRRLDLAIERGDRLAIAVIESRLGFAPADRYIRQT